MSDIDPSFHRGRLWHHAALACLLWASALTPSLAQSQAGAARIGLDTTPEALCALVEGLPKAGGMGRVVKAGGKGQPNYIVGNGQTVAAHAMSCMVEDRKNPKRSATLTVITSANSRTHAAVLEDTGFKPDEYKPVERLSTEGGECHVSTGSMANPDKPMTTVLRWEAVCSASKGLKVVEVLLSHSDRAELPRLNEVRDAFVLLMKRM